MTTEQDPPDEPPDDPADEPADGPGEETAPDDGAGEDTGASGDFWTEGDHDDTGLDLARSLARSTAGAARMAPRKKKRKPYRGPIKGKRGSGAHPDDRDPQTIDTTLGRLVADQGWAMDLKVHSVFGRWSTIVGDEVAQHCQPTSYADGKLVVRTDSTAWATQLRMLAPSLVRRLNEELGHGSVTLIEVEGPNLPTWKKGRFSSRDGRGPRDTYG